jgi:hypothetical protein
MKIGLQPLSVSGHEFIRAVKCKKHFGLSHSKPAGAKARLLSSASARLEAMP